MSVSCHDPIRSSARSTYRWGLIALLALVTQSCVTPVDPDRDDDAGLARALAPGERHTDTLECSRGDCVDWFRIRISESGTLAVELETRTPGPGTNSLRMLIANDRAQMLRDSRADRSGRSQLRERVQPGYYFVRISTPSRARIAYDLTSRLETVKARPARPTPARTAAKRASRPKRLPARPTPGFEMLGGRIIEVERRPGKPPDVLFVMDGADRVRTGLRGRLRDGERTLAEVEIVEI